MSKLEHISDIARDVAAQTSRAFTPLRVMTEEMDDWQGEPSLQVTLVLPEKAFKENDVGEHLTKVALGIREKLIAEGELRFPFVGVAAERGP